MLMKPVTFPPGRARLATTPLRAGSASEFAMTIGIVLVACLAARVASMPAVTMQSALSRTNSVAIAGSRAALPFENRHSMVVF